MPLTSPMSRNVRELLESSVRATGGERWRALSGLRLSVRACAPLLAMRGRNPRWRSCLVEIGTREPRAVLDPYGPPGCRGVYEGDWVRIESPSGATMAERKGARAHARGRVLWDSLDELYLLAYSFWNYLNAPFLFLRDGFDAVELEPWRDPSSGEHLRRVRVRFAAGVPCHCPEQLYYFDERALIARLDYGAEVLNPNRRGAHLCESYRDWGGLLVASRRRAVPYRLDGRPLRWFPSLMEARIDDVQLIEAT